MHSKRMDDEIPNKKSDLEAVTPKRLALEKKCQE